MPACNSFSLTGLSRSLHCTLSLLLSLSLYVYSPLFTLSSLISKFLFIAFVYVLFLQLEFTVLCICVCFVVVVVCLACFLVAVVVVYLYFCFSVFEACLCLSKTRRELVNESKSLTRDAPNAASSCSCRFGWQSSTEFVGPSQAAQELKSLASLSTLLPLLPTPTPTL